jgi:DNA repair protein RecO (recombination protein O)
MLAGGALFAGFYLNELLLKLLARQDAAPGAVRCLCRRPAGAAGADDAARAEAALRAFELLLLREMGVLPELDQVTLTRRRCSPGALRAARARPASWRAGDDRPCPPQALAGSQAALASGDGCRRCARPAGACPPPARGQLRGLLHYHLGTRCCARAR